MSNVIDFVERMGQDAQLRHASMGDVELALMQAQIDPEIRAAILAKDQRKLELLLGGGNVCCALCPAEEEEEQDEPKEAPAREEDEISLDSPVHVVASVG
ncbi:MAG TPA: hypothetical protein VN731_08915 [Rhodanobacter sp.]|nr:hypothetical protein [Rhodanobacter sp.]